MGTRFKMHKNWDYDWCTISADSTLHNCSSVKYNWRRLFLLSLSITPTKPSQNPSAEPTPTPQGTSSKSSTLAADVKRILAADEVVILLHMLPLHTMYIWEQFTEGCSKLMVGRKTFKRFYRQQTLGWNLMQWNFKIPSWVNNSKHYMITSALSDIQCWKLFDYTTAVNRAWLVHVMQLKQDTS